MYNIDCRVIETEQYSRRENIIISGIPESINQNNLERTVIRILRTIGLKITSYEITACHRLKKLNPKYPSRTIVRFTNRRSVDFCLLHRERLAECKPVLRMNLRFYENLCEANETVVRYCNKLKTAGFIHEFYLRNGFVKIKVEEGDKPSKIYHPEILIQKFENFFEALDDDR